MTRDDIIRMARECGFDDYEQDAMLERFAALVAAAEREECAKVCEDRIGYWQRGDSRRTEDEHCAAAIRARGKA